VSAVTKRCFTAWLPAVLRARSLTADSDVDNLSTCCCKALCSCCRLDTFSACFGVTAAFQDVLSFAYIRVTSWSLHSREAGELPGPL